MMMNFHLSVVLAALQIGTLAAAAEFNANLLSDPAWQTQSSSLARITPGGDGALTIRYDAAPDGWPLVNFALPPAPEGVTTMTVQLRLETPPEALKAGILLEVPGDKKFPGGYINEKLKFNEVRTLHFTLPDKKAPAVLRLALRRPPTPVQLTLVSVKYQKVNPITAGYSFESPGDTGQWSAWGGATAEVVAAHPASGKNSLKVHFKDAQSGVTMIPDVTDWSRYAELHFTVYNPQPAPNTKFRVLYVNDRELNGKCNISWGIIRVYPETATRFRLKLNTMNPEIDRTNIKNIAFYKGNPDTTFYIDDVRLYTEQDLRDMEREKIRAEVQSALELLRQGETSASAYLREQMTQLKPDIEKMRHYETSKISDADRKLLTRARELAVLGIAERHHPDRSLGLSGAAPSLKVFRDLPLADSVKPYRMLAAGNERESFQVVALPFQPLKAVTVSAGELIRVRESGQGKREQIGAENILIQPVGYVEVVHSFYFPSSRTGFWPDVLVHNQPLELKDRLQPYYVTIRVPAGQQPGVYRGEIHFAVDGVAAQSFPYELEVCDFALPVKGKLYTFFDFRYAPADQRIRRKCYEQLFAHRLQPIAMYLNGKTPEDPAKYQFIPHLDDLEFCLKRGQNMICLWYLYNGQNTADPYRFDDEFRRRFAKFIDYCQPILKAKKAWDLTMVSGFDEIMMHDPKVIAARLGEARGLCGWIKDRYPELRIGNVGPKMAIAPELMDMWYMINQPRNKFADITAAGKQVSFYWVYDDPSPMLDLPGMAGRIMAWQAFREGAAGIGYYSTYRPWALGVKPENAPTGVDWPKETINMDCYNPPGHPQPRVGRVGDGNLFYPDRDGSVLPSTRLANIRDGIEDYEWLAILQTLQPDHPLLQIPDRITALVSGAYTKDQTVIDNYRRQVARAIEAGQKARP